MWPSPAAGIQDPPHPQQVSFDTRLRHGFTEVKHTLLVILILVAVALTITSIQWTTRADPVYSPAQVVVALQRYPAAWIGRTIRVRGRVVKAVWLTTINGRILPLSTGVFDANPAVRWQWVNHPACIMNPQGCPSPLLTVARPPGASTYLSMRVPALGVTQPALLLSVPLTPAPDPIRAFLRRLPVVGAAFVLSSRRVRWGAPMIYRVHLVRVGTLCLWPTRVCADGVLLDAQV